MSLQISANTEIFTVCVVHQPNKNKKKCLEYSNRDQDDITLEDNSVGNSSDNDNNDTNSMNDFIEDDILPPLAEDAVQQSALQVYSLKMKIYLYTATIPYCSTQ